VVIIENRAIDNWLLAIEDISRDTKINMYSTIVDTTKLPWAALDFPGVSMRVIHEDKKSGGMTVMTRLEPGASIPAHIHTKADETVFVISGDFIEDAVEHGPGSFFAAAAGVPHGPHRSRAGCVVLTTFSASLDFQVIDYLVPT
jgi:quercetin dioxygenase-like cupin family protein